MIAISKSFKHYRYLVTHYRLSAVSIQHSGTLELGPLTWSTTCVWWYTDVPRYLTIPPLSIVQKTMNFLHQQQWIVNPIVGVIR